MTTIFISKMEGLPPTSDIKMIDLWLVFCQMIPFAEVVLLTAMEYQRTGEGDDLSNSKCIQVASVLEEEVEGNTKKWYKNINLKTWIPSLKTMGKFTNDTFSLRVKPNLLFQSKRWSQPLC